jgi:hypothetical protein
MAFIGSMLGAGQGSDFVAAGNPQGNAINPTNEAQIGAAYLGSNDALYKQLSLLASLQKQQGIQNQSDVYNQLRGMATGSGPNPAQAQYMQNANQLAAQTAGLIGSQKGMSPALQARLIAQQGANAGQNAAGQAATMQAQQQMGAINAMGNMANTQATNEIGQTNAIAGSQMAEQGQLLNALGNYNSANAGILENVNNTNSATQIQNSKAQQGIFGGLLGGAGGILSDEDAKTGVRPADDKIQQFLDNVGAHEYSYKGSVQGHPGTSPGRHIGPMAQELQKSDLGKEMLINTPDGMGVDFSRGLGTIVAAQASLNKRLEALEGKKMAGGGMVAPQNFDMGGMAISPTPNAFAVPFNASGPQSNIGKLLSGASEPRQQNNMQAIMSGDNPIQGGMSKFTENLMQKYVKPVFSSDTAGSMATSAIDPMNAPVDMGVGLTPAEGAVEGTAVEGMGSAAGATSALEAAEGAETAYGGAELVAALARGGRVSRPLGSLHGEKYARKMKPVPGRAKVGGDSERNDTVNAKLSPGEIIIPRSIANHPNAPEMAARFVAAVKAKNGRGIG